jgi:predicted kinase
MAERGYIICSDDSVVNAVHSNVYTLYSKDCKPIYKQIENTIVTSALTVGRSVVVDRGVNNKRKSRARFIGLAHALDAKVVAVRFPVDPPEVVALRRFNHDSRGISLETWKEIAERHQSEWEEPTIEEGFDEIYTFDTYKDVQAAGWWI